MTVWCRGGSDFVWLSASLNTMDSGLAWNGVDGSGLLSGMVTWNCGILSFGALVYPRPVDKLLCINIPYCWLGKSAKNVSTGFLFSIFGLGGTGGGDLEVGSDNGVLEVLWMFVRHKVFLMDSALCKHWCAKAKRSEEDVEVDITTWSQKKKSL